MICAYIFAVLAIIGYPGFHATATQWVQWISQTFIQLVMLSVIMVGQSILGRQQELQADEQFHTTMSSYHDIEQIMQHLSAQDAELLRHGHMLMHLLEKSGISLQQLEAEGATTSHLDSFVQLPAATATPATPTPTENEKQNA
jgi:predicted N-acyltransferase